MCELRGMEKPTVTALSEQAGISKSYACEILGERTPSRPLAIHIFRKTGWRHSIIAELSDDDMATLERIEPWTPPTDRQERAA